MVSATKDLDQTVGSFFELLGFEGPDLIKDERPLRREESIRSQIADMPQAARSEVLVLERNGVLVALLLARDLAENQVFSV
jgi:hypothetical protein